MGEDRGGTGGVRLGMKFGTKVERVQRWTGTGVYWVRRSREPPK